MKALVFQFQEAGSIKYFAVCELTKQARDYFLELQKLKDALGILRRDFSSVRVSLPEFISIGYMTDLGEKVSPFVGDYEYDTCGVMEFSEDLSWYFSLGTDMRATLDVSSIWVSFTGETGFKKPYTPSESFETILSFFEGVEE